MAPAATAIRSGCLWHVNCAHSRTALGHTYEFRTNLNANSDTKTNPGAFVVAYPGLRPSCTDYAPLFTISRLTDAALIELYP